MSVRLLSQLAHVELITPTPEASLDFWTRVVGLEVSSERVGSSAYLRGWGDRFHHTLVLTEGEQPGLGHIGWRADGPEELTEAVAPDRRRGSRRGLDRELDRTRARPTATAAPAATCTRSSGRSSAFSRRRRWLRRSRTVRSATVRAASPPAASTT